MGFIGDAVGGVVGSIAGGMTPKNNYQATAPTNAFQAQQAQLGQNNFGSSIEQALAQQGGIFGQQQALANQLQQQAAGNGPSLAQPLLQQATDQNTNLAAGQIASQRGINPGMAARQIETQRAGIQQQGAQQASLLRNQEQLGAQGMLGNTLGGMTNFLGTVGGLQQGQNSLALQNSLGTQGLNQATAAQNANLQSHATDINAGIASQNAANQTAVMGGILGGAGAVAGASLGGGKALGGEIPGQPEAAGDDPKNDTVPAQLSPGEIVLPRSVAQAENAPELAAEFVRAIRRKHYAQGGQVPAQGYGRVLAMHRDHEQRLARLESTRKAMGKK